jgi:hypothetical protein
MNACPNELAARSTSLQTSMHALTVRPVLAARIFRVPTVTIAGRAVLPVGSCVSAATMATQALSEEAHCFDASLRFESYLVATGDASIPIIAVGQVR